MIHSRISFWGVMLLMLMEMFKNNFIENGIFNHVGKIVFGGLDFEVTENSLDC